METQAASALAEYALAKAQPVDLMSQCQIEKARLCMQTGFSFAGLMLLAGFSAASHTQPLG